MSVKGDAARAAFAECFRQMGITADAATPVVMALGDVVETCERIDNNGTVLFTRVNAIKAKTDLLPG